MSKDGNINLEIRKKRQFNIHLNTELLITKSMISRSENLRGTSHPSEAVDHCHFSLRQKKQRVMIREDVICRMRWEWTFLFWDWFLKRSSSYYYNTHLWVPFDFELWRVIESLLFYIILVFFVHTKFNFGSHHITHQLGQLVDKLYKYISNLVTLYKIKLVREN